MNDSAEGYVGNAGRGVWAYGSCMGAQFGDNNGSGVAYLAYADDGIQHRKETLESGS